MKQIFTFFLATAFSLSALATTFTYDADGTQTQTKDGITVKLEKGSGSYSPAYSSYNGMKIYANNTITIDAEKAFKNVQLVFSKNDGKDYLPMTASSGELVSGGTSTALNDKKTDVWTGEETHLVFTMGTKGQRVLFQIEIDGDSIIIDPDQPEEPQELDSTFVYGEPTVIFSPDTTFYKQEYTFIDSNIRVHCTQGSIVSNDTDAYFNCNAGYALTFEATQPFKGVVIKGYVRKAFSASVDKGDIEYLNPEWEDEEADPVVVIKNIDSTAFTISCEKQLRISAARFYFEENPTESINDTTKTEGEVFFLIFDTADAVYEAEISEDEGKTNYSIYLYDAATEYPYIALDLYPEMQSDSSDLVGIYDFEEGTLGEYTYYQGEEDFMTRFWITEGSVVVTKQGETYTISGYITCDDYNTYNFSFTGSMTFYTDDEYYGEEEGVENVQGDKIPCTKVLRNGQLYIFRGDRIYNILGF